MNGDRWLNVPSLMQPDVLQAQRIAPRDGPMTRSTKTRHQVVFLLDVDNTLLHNDQVTEELRTYLTNEFGQACQESYWAIFESLRAELGYADYLGALQRYRVRNLHDPEILGLSSWLLNYPFAERLYPGALAVLEHLAQWGPTVILTDGDVVFQPRKVQRSGLFDAVDGRVLIYIHKERELEAVERRYPAKHYVLVDDKVRILTAVKEVWNQRVTTVFPRQGHYAHDADVAKYPPPDVTVARIRDLLDLDLPTVLRVPLETNPQ